MDENTFKYDFLITSSRMFAKELGDSSLIGVEVEVDYLNETLHYTLPLVSADRSVDELKQYVMRDLEEEDIKDYIHKTINNLLYLQRDLVDVGPQSWDNYTRFMDNIVLGNYD